MRGCRWKVNYFFGFCVVEEIYILLSIVRLFCSNNEISDMIAHAFLDPNTSIDCIDELGVRLMRIVYRTTPTTSSTCLERSSLSAYQQLRILIFNTAHEYFSNAVSGCFFIPIWRILHSFVSGIEIGVCFCRCTPANQRQPRSSRLSFRVTVEDPAPRTSTDTPWTV